MLLGAAIFALLEFYCIYVAVVEICWIENIKKQSPLNRFCECEILTEIDIFNEFSIKIISMQNIPPALLMPNGFHIISGKDCKI